MVKMTMLLKSFEGHFIFTTFIFVPSVSFTLYGQLIVSVLAGTVFRRPSPKSVPTLKEVTNS